MGYENGIFQNPWSANNSAEYEYYYVYEDIEDEEYNDKVVSGSNKTERDADHFIGNPHQLPSLTPHGWIPSFHQPQKPVSPDSYRPPIDAYGVPKEPPRTAEIPR